MYKGFWLPLKNHKNKLSYCLKGVFLSSCFLAMPSLLLSQNEAEKASVRSIELNEQKYSGMIQKRFKAWKKLILNAQNQSLDQKLKSTNDFFNQFIFEADSDNYSADYWKTPDEFIIDGAGDCEDFSIAKYFTLISLGVSLKALRITYVKAIAYDRAHMVLAYYPSPEAEPLILDNLNAAILPASKRPDLIPVYSFNGEGLWLAKQRGKDKALGNSSHLGKWRSLLQRMQTKELP